MCPCPGCVLQWLLCSATAEHKGIQCWASPIATRHVITRTLRPIVLICRGSMLQCEERHILLSGRMSCERELDTNILTSMTMFMVLSSWRGHYKSSPSSFDECRLSAIWMPTLKPSQPTWPVSPSVDCHHPHPSSPFIIITQSES